MRRATVAICALALAAPAAAEAADPGRWIVTGETAVPSRYRQGLASDPRLNVYYSGATVGLYRTREGRQTGNNGNVIPQDVIAREKYNHIGDIAWDAAEGGRLLLPLESYVFGAPEPNPAKTGSFGVAGPRTLQWRYYVKLDPAEIPKAMWVATTPDGLAWTSTGQDLLAYRLSEVSPANAAPGGPVLRSVRRLAGAAPPTGIAGGVEFGGRLYLSTGEGDVQRLHSVDLRTGASRVEHEREISLEPEGVDVGPYAGGILHWELANILEGFPGTVLHMLPKGAPLRLRLSRRTVRSGRTASVRGRVFAAVGRTRVPLAGVTVRLAGARDTSDATGRVSVRIKPTRGRYRATATYRGLRTGVARLRAT